MFILELNMNRIAKIGFRMFYSIEQWCNASQNGVPETIIR